VGFYYLDKNYYEDYMDTTIFVNFGVLAPLSAIFQLYHDNQF
jgi:hypothetical protein